MGGRLYESIQGRGAVAVAMGEVTVTRNDPAALLLFRKTFQCGTTQSGSQRRRGRAHHEIASSRRTHEIWRKLGKAGRSMLSTVLRRRCLILSTTKGSIGRNGSLASVGKAWPGDT